MREELVYNWSALHVHMSAWVGLSQGHAQRVDKHKVLRFASHLSHSLRINLWKLDLTSQKPHDKYNDVIEDSDWSG